MSILKSTDILGAGDSYTFTYDDGLWFQPSDQSVLDQLRPLLVNFGDVSSVSRGFFSGRLAITVIPKDDFYLKDWIGDSDPENLGGFAYAFNAMGWDNASFVQAEGGAKSTKPGGITEVITDTAGVFGNTAGDTLLALLKPLAPYLIIGAGVLLAYEYMKGKK